jgi:hypothetical protein
MLLSHCTEVFDQIKAYIAEGRAANPGDLEQVRITKVFFFPSKVVSELCYFLLSRVLTF